MQETDDACFRILSHEEGLRKVRGVIQRYKDMQGALIPMLHAVQGLFGYLPEDALEIVSQETSISMAEIYGVATFYSFFSLEPKGEHVIRICLGTACYVKGANEVLERIEETLGVGIGETTTDGKFTIEAVRCVGACALSPVLMIEEDVHGKLTAQDVDEIVEEVRGAITIR